MDPHHFSLHDIALAINKQWSTRFDDVEYQMKIVRVEPIKENLSYLIECKVVLIFQSGLSSLVA